MSPSRTEPSEPDSNHYGVYPRVRVGTRGDAMHDRAMRHSDDDRIFLLGLLCGLTAGTVLGLLVAPGPCAELLERLSDSAGRVRRGAARAYDRASASIDEVAEHGHAAIERGRHGARAVLEGVASTTRVTGQ